MSQYNLTGAQTPSQYYESETGLGNYQFTSLENVINQFMVAYVGEDKIISKVKKSDVAFHAQRAMQELSFDTFKSCKSKEITLPASLQMALPQDYVNYTKLAWSDASGVEHIIYPISKTSNPNFIPYQDDEGEHNITPIAKLVIGENIIELDGDYKSILLHGMKVSGPHVKNNSYIHGISNVGGVTLLTLKSKDGTVVKNATATHSEEVVISRFSFAFYPNQILNNISNTLVETTVSEAAAAGTGSNFIKVTSSAGIEKGMFVNHPGYPNVNNAVTVLGVGVNTVEVSDDATFDIVLGDNIHFVSNNKDSSTWTKYKSSTPSENNNDDYKDDTYWPAEGRRYGLDPQHSQVNGSFYIDCSYGKIHFSSNLFGKTIVLKYLSDGLGTTQELQVHKFAEEAMYKWIAHAVLATRANVPEYQVARFKKERFAAIRTAKLRLSNIKLEEITQILRGKSKIIKH
tara:strand:- start:5772 stop:7148 length:1377 start_codon:yes stop_codon:yes gene_type:complete